MATMMLALAVHAATAAGAATDPAPRPVDDPATWVTPADYPAAARRANLQGTSAVRLAVVESGGVTGCEVTASSGWALLDAQSCGLLKQRARFTPAAVRGRKVASVWQSKFTWRMPSAPAMLGSWARATTMVVDPSGAVPSCSMQASGPATQADYCLAVRFLVPEGRTALLGGTQPAAIEVRELHTIDGGQAIDMGDTAGRDVLFTSRIRYTVDPAGEITRCTIEENKGTDSFHMLDGGCDPSLDYGASAGAGAGAQGRQVTLTRIVLRQRLDAPAAKPRPTRPEPFKPRPGEIIT